MRRTLRRMRGAAAAVAAIAAIAAAAACAPARQPVPRLVPDAPPTGWLIPPDSVDALSAPANTVIVHPRMSGPYQANLVLLAFRDGATAAERDRAVAAVRGTVVGGDAGFYYVLVEADCADHPVWCAIDILEPLPQVDQAQPYLYGAAPGPAPMPVPRDTAG